ncbi:hypothetical protein ACERK3_08235 [Phycisphaerales bacterium AB-hyl4]|uniref:ABC transmembrane type-1 domain-containing protein n=1 Tax=Natronomicrosphaera hydrolytica TaxID=3242702 RepID=A0ABV4U4M7_9BACT
MLPPAKKLVTQLRRYARIVGWVYRDSLRRFWRETLMLLAMRFCGIQFFVATFGVVGYYAHLLENNQTLEFVGRSFQPRESLTLLLLLSCLALCALVAAAVCTYLANRGALKTSLRYETFCSKRLIALASRTDIVPPGKNPTLSKRKYLLTMARSYARECGRVYRMLVGNVIPSLIVLLIIAPLLLYLNPLLSLLIVALLTLSLAIHYPLNIRGAHHSLTREKTAGEAALTYRDLLAQAEHQSLPLKQQTIEERFDNHSLRSNLHAYMGRLLAQHNSQLVSDVFIAVSVVLILIVLGGNILMQGTGWSALIVYLLALRFGLTHFKALMAGVAGVNRFYHQVDQYLTFVEFVGQPHPPTAAVDALTLTPESPSIEASMSQCEVHVGSRVAVLCTTSLNRFTLVGLARSLTRLPEGELASLLAGSTFLSEDAHLPVGYTWREAMGITGEHDGQGWQAFLEERGLAATEPDLPLPALDTPITEAIQSEMPAADRLLLALLIVACRGKAWLWIEARALSCLNEQYEAVVDKLLSRHAVLVLGEKVDHVGRQGETVVAVLDDAALVGLGDVTWAQTHREQIEAVLGVKSKGDGTLVGSLEDDDETE